MLKQLPFNWPHSLQAMYDITVFSRAVLEIQGPKKRGGDYTGKTFLRIAYIHMNHRIINKSDLKSSYSQAKYWQILGRYQ